MTEKEGYYNIFVNDENEIMFAIRERESEPENPFLVYAGGEHAVLCRSGELNILLDYVHSEVRKLLREAKEALIVELRDGELAREYKVVVRQERKLSISGEEMT